MYSQRETKNQSSEIADKRGTRIIIKKVWGSLNTYIPYHFHNKIFMKNYVKMWGK
jgi:hypothetical protein